MNTIRRELVKPLKYKKQNSLAILRKILTNINDITLRNALERIVKRIYMINLYYVRFLHKLCFLNSMLCKQLFIYILSDYYKIQINIDKQDDAIHIILGILVILLLFTSRSAVLPVCLGTR